MIRWHHNFACAALLLISTNEVLCARDDGILSKEHAALAQKITKLCRANDASIRSVQCEYSMFINTMERRCRYARDAGRYYHASVDVYPNGARSLARETAWDGEIAACRPNPHYFTRSVDARDAKPACPTPQSAVAEFMSPLLAAVDGTSEYYRLTAVRMVTIDGQECVELSFASKRSGGSAVSRHSATQRYVPISCAYYLGSGDLESELTTIEYEVTYAEGNTVYYPVRIVKRTFSDRKIQDHIRYDVERATLAVNKPISGTHFQLTPWPSDIVIDLNTLRELPPQNPNWSPVGNARFPYDVYYKGVKPEDARNTMYVAGNTRRASDASGSPDPKSNDSSDVPRISGGIGGWGLLLGCGVVLALGGTGWAWRQRRARR